MRGFLYKIIVAPVPDIQSEFESQAMQLLGRDVEITGVFVQGRASQTGGPNSGVQFWTYTGPPEKEPKGDIKAPEIKLEKLVTTPGTRDGQMIRVVGKFRGRNLYGDLPVSTQRTTADWVIKEDLYAVWVTGRKPKGSGWELDSGLKRDTGKWVEVIGKPETIKDGGLGEGNLWIARDLIEAIEKDRQPRGSMYDGRAALEMILAVYESHRLKGPVELPLKNRQHPLGML